MPSIESPQQEVSIAEDITGRLREALTGAPSDNYNFRQIQLIYDKIKRDHPGTNINREQLDAFAMDWANSKLSTAFSDIKCHPEFETHSRLLGNIANITLEDVEYFANTGKMPG